jgi:hypothetical protein
MNNCSLQIKLPRTTVHNAWACDVFNVYRSEGINVCERIIFKWLTLLGERNEDLSMMQICKKRLVLLLLSFVLLIISSGCATSTLRLVDNDRLHLQYDGTHLVMSGKVAAQQQINLGSVYVRQNVFELSDGGIVVFEYARVRPGYRYNYALKRSIDIIFNAATVHEVDTFFNIGFFRVTLRNGCRVNIIAENGNKKYIRMVYGFGDDAFDALMQQLRKGKERERSLSGPAGMISKPEKAIRTRWNPKMLLLDSLVVKTGGYGVQRATSTGASSREDLRP